MSITMLKEVDTKKGENFLQDCIPLKKVVENHNQLVEGGMSVEDALKEAHVSADYVSMADIINRSLFKKYTMPESKPMYDLTKLCEQKTTIDFRDIKIYQLHEIDTMPEVLEKENYKGKDMKDVLKKQYGLKKWGLIYSCSWEAWVNDNLDEIKQVPNKLMRSAIRRKIINISALYENNLVFFNAANANIGAGVVNEANVEIGIETMAAQTGLDGEPIYTIPKYLVVGTDQIHAGKRIVADFQAIVSAINKNTMPLNYDLELLVDPRIPVGTNRWYLFADPNELPALQMLFLKGHKEPELFIRESDQRRITELAGMGGKDAFGGTFTNDDIEFKGRDIHNEVTYDHRGAYMSTGG